MLVSGISVFFCFYLHPCLLVIRILVTGKTHSLSSQGLTVFPYLNTNAFSNITKG